MRFLLQILAKTAVFACFLIIYFALCLYITEYEIQTDAFDGF